MNLPSRRNVLIAAGIAAAGILGFFVGREQVKPDLRVDQPLIGIASLTSDSYAWAVRESGGIPIVLPNVEGSDEKIDEYLDLLDGLILPGGADIPPSEYGEEMHESVELLAEDRFLFEKALSKAWIEKTDKPLLGICLGCQWINVASGGTLIQDIPTEVGTNHRDTAHPIEIEEDSRLREIFGETDIEVNSLHHQAIDDVGKNLRIVARSPDGVVEAAESTDPNRFLIAVQWHPEKLMPENKQQAKLLKAFVEAAAESKTQN